MPHRKRVPVHVHRALVDDVEAGCRIAADERIAVKRPVVVEAVLLVDAKAVCDCAEVVHARPLEMEVVVEAQPLRTAAAKACARCSREREGGAVRDDHRRRCRHRLRTRHQVGVHHERARLDAYLARERRHLRGGHHPTRAALAEDRRPAREILPHLGERLRHRSLPFLLHRHIERLKAHRCRVRAAIHGHGVVRVRLGRIRNQAERHGRKTNGKCVLFHGPFLL